MTNFAPVSGLVGGTLIGLAAIILMLTIGRIAGVSGIVLNAMTASDAAGSSWRLAFILGLPLGALLVTAVGLKDWSSMSFPVTMPTMVIAGFIVGVGSTFGSGCTSGHGICGLARFSMRSIVATVTFIASAAATFSLSVTWSRQFDMSLIFSLLAGSYSVPDSRSPTWSTRPGFSISWMSPAVGALTQFWCR
jgi:uncharacterized protein